MAERPPYRLPRTVVPRHYRLEITPDLAKDRFTGTEMTDIDVLAPVKEFILNADNLTLTKAALKSKDGTEIPGTVTYNADEEQVAISWPDTVNPGAYTLSARWDGVLASDLRGFYRTTVKNSDGQPVVIASTQCEATDARRIFPCWDEPDFKAVFSITLVVDPALTALSNGHEISSEIDAQGLRRVTFAQTIPMSTYLVALIVGPFELTAPVMMDQVPVRIAARPGFSHLTSVAEEAAVATLRFFQNYFGIPFPADKLDHVAIPEFAAGAMENLGCITYREEALLVNREQSSPMERMQIVEVIAHETAHMWFGDLVTMRWWNGLWLNEAFATFMQILATDALHPEWDVWTTFGPGRSYAMTVDGLASTRPIEYPVGPPSESWGMFDVLTYEKGGAVLRMMEQYLGPEVFQQGIRVYLDRHRYKNTETGDLWDALESSSGQPVRAVMDSWVLQGGYPIVKAEQSADLRELHLSQHQFRYQGDGDGTWQIPLVLGIHQKNGASDTVRLLLGKESLTTPLPEDVAWVSINQGHWGFYRAAYGQALWDNLMKATDEMTALERLGLADDVWAAVLADDAPLTQAVRLWRTLVHERNPEVWMMVSHQLGLIDTIADDKGRAALQKLIQDIALPLFLELGWEQVPGESVQQGRLRALLMRLLGTTGGDRDIQKEARARFTAHISGAAAIAPDLLTAIATVVAYSGGETEWNALHQEFKKAASPQDEKRYLYALAEFTQPDLVQRSLTLYRSDEVRVQDGTSVLGRMLSNRHARRATWTMIEDHWDEIIKKYPQFMLHALVEPISMIVEDDLADRTVSWLSAHPLTDVARQVAQAQEFQAINRAMARRIGENLTPSLEAGRPS